MQRGEAVRIFTGGVIPDGADAVVIQEDTTRDGDTVQVNEAAGAGRHIRRAGIDFRAGRRAAAKHRSACAIAISRWRPR